MISEIKLVECTFIPKEASEGVLYYSEKYRTTSHLCACGCGQKVVLSVKPQDWSIKINDGKATLYPSIGNRLFDCKSHYFIRDGQIVWLAPMSEAAAAKSIERDRKHRESYFNAQRPLLVRLIRKLSAFLRQLMRKLRP